MKKRLGLTIVVATAFTAIAAHAEDNAAVKKDLARLQGEWSMQSATADGLELPEAMRSGFKRICKDNELTVKNGDQLIMRAKITIDPSKTPKTIDYDVVEGPTKGKKHLGIYEFDGDTLKSCFAAPDMERPTDFTSKQGEKRTLSVWKHEK
jgi:uncharacterized protein (TIGR03067 family)